MSTASEIRLGDLLVRFDGSQFEFRRAQETAEPPILSEADAAQLIQFVHERSPKSQRELKIEWRLFHSR